MSKKRAFVRYSKQGKIVPGSLILTSGSYPNGPSTWKEVPADLCCPVYSSTLVIAEPQVTVLGEFCADIINLYGSIASYNLYGTGAFGTIEQIVAYLNTNYSNIGAWEAVSATEIGVRFNIEYVNILGAPVSMGLSCGG